MESTLSFAAALLVTAILTHDTDAVEELANVISSKELTYLSFKDAIASLNQAMTQVEAQHPDWKKSADMITALSSAAAATLPDGMVISNTP